VKGTLAGEHVQAETDRRLVEPARTVEAARVEELSVGETELVDAVSEDAVEIRDHRAAISAGTLHLSVIRARDAGVPWRSQSKH